MSTHKFDLNPKDEAAWDEFSKLIADNADSRMQVEIKLGDGRRTLTQNAAMHKYFELLSDALNEAGLDMVQTLTLLQANDLEIQWTPEQVKERLWRPIQIAKTDKQSSAELEKAEVSMVYEILNQYLQNVLGMQGIPFPDRWGR